MAYFQTKNPNLGKILVGLAKEDTGIFCGHLVYCRAIWYILWRFAIFYDNLVHFSRFGMLYEDKSGNPVSAAKS
jgi:hypothetical protein